MTVYVQLLYFSATSSSTYAQYWYGAYVGYWGPQFATNNAISYWNVYFFHSGYEAYPYLKVALSAAKTITAMRMQTRCDANQWWHYQDIEFRMAATGGITFIPGAAITTGTSCGNLQMTGGYRCGAYTKTCTTATASMQEVSVQQKTLDSHGGGWGQHSNTAAYFLMINELYIY